MVEKIGDEKSIRFSDSLSKRIDYLAAIGNTGLWDQMENSS